ncbi:mannosyltransferase family protein [Streptomyces sp. G-G2]|uniref:mannosyltransferase family protein n=1 Tax=Streptomyces sp. G-G2 TaxID=3046201 RepID=UPI0024BB4D3D|nr:mannosyltransferase family protein [Streptomyces sp. G-G2]MDJ0382530.1 mannosyltransferase family protein [Streptomyces sp. G-G2]
MSTGTRTVTASARPGTAGLSAGATALAVFAVVRGGGVLLIALGAWWAGKDPVAVLGTSWDSGWYIAITEHGYGRSLAWPATGSVQSDLAFFPLYPSLMRLTCVLLPVGAAGAGLLVAWSAAAAAAVGVYRVGERVAGKRAGVLLVALWGVQPHAVVFTTGYTESLLAALAAWSLYALLRERWLWAAGLAILAGLTRPTGIAVAAAVSVTALYALVARGEHRRAEVWAAGLLAPAGWAAYLLAVGWRRRDPLGGYFAVQDAWGSRFDFGAGAVRAASRVLTGQGSPNSAMTLAVLALAVGLAVLLALDRAPLPLLVYTAVLLVITLGGAGFFDSKPRFLLPAFPLLLPLAAAMARARPRTAVVATGALAGLSYLYGTYLMLISHVPL